MDLVQSENLQSNGGPSVGNHQCVERMRPSKLYSWRKELVAQGRVILADGPQRIHGKPPREDFYKVALDIIIKGDTELPEPDGYHSTLGFGENRRANVEDLGILTGREVGKFIQLISTFVGGFVVAFVQGWLPTLVMLLSIPPLVLSGAAMAIMISKMASRGQTAYAEACFRGRGELYGKKVYLFGCTEHEPWYCQSYEMVGKGASTQYERDRICASSRRFLVKCRKQTCYRFLLPRLWRLQSPPSKDLPDC